MTEADHPGTIDPEEYLYDANGNRINGSYDIDPNNQMRSDGVYTYEYDDEGNRESRTDITTGEYTEYTWDHRNRLVAVDTWTNSGKGTKEKGVRYTYDAFDRRIAKEIDEDANGVFTDTVDWGEHFVYDGDHIALVFDEDGSLKNRCLHGPAIDQVLAEETFDSMGLSDEVYWQLADNLGSIRDIVTYDDSTDTSTTVEHIVYGAFGNIISATSSIVVRFAYTGREFDIETGMNYLRARYYDAENGRFVSEDPIGFLAGDPNLSRYVFNASTRLVDPSGMCGWDWYWNNPVSGVLASAIISVADFVAGAEGLDEEFEHNSHRYDGFLNDPANAEIPSTAGGGRRTEASIAVVKGLAEGSVNFTASAGSFVSSSTAATAGRSFVYRSVDELGNVQYVGITNNIAKRGADHLKTKGIKIEPILSGLCRSDARPQSSVP